MNRFKKSKYAFTFLSREGRVALYHSLNMNLIYLQSGLLDVFEQFNLASSINEVEKVYRQVSPGSSDFIQALIQTGLIVKEGLDEEGGIKMILSQIEPDISVLYLLLTDNCNLRCRYCTVQYNLSNQETKTMSSVTITQALSLFRGLMSNSRKRNITFFGGEPLLNKEGLRFGLKEIKRLFLPDEVSVFIVTNGTLIDKEIASLFLENDVFAIISLDGWPEIHNQMRVYAQGQESYEEVIAGYYRLKDLGLKVGISTLVGKHNCNYLPQIVDFFAQELGAFNLGMSLPHLKPDIAEIEIELLTLKLIQSWQAARKNSFYIMQLGSRLKAFARQEPKLRSCPGYSGWSMIRVLPDGKITLCENMGLRDMAVLGYTHNSLSPELILQHPDVLDWNRRSQYSFQECWLCPAIGICGGGCPYDAYLSSGTIYQPEWRSCYLSKALLEWAIWDIYEQIKDREDGLGFMLPSKEERDLVLGDGLDVLQKERWFR